MTREELDHIVREEFKGPQAFGMYLFEDAGVCLFEIRPSKWEYDWEKGKHIAVPQGVLGYMAIAVLPPQHKELATLQAEGPQTFSDAVAGVFPNFPRYTIQFYLEGLTDGAARRMVQRAKERLRGIAAPKGNGHVREIRV